MSVRSGQERETSSGLILPGNSEAKEERVSSWIRQLPEQNPDQYTGTIYYLAWLICMAFRKHRENNTCVDLLVKTRG